MKSRNGIGGILTSLIVLALLISAAAALSVSAAPEAARRGPGPKFSTAVVFDVSPALRDLALAQKAPPAASSTVREVRPEHGLVAPDRGFSGDEAVQGAVTQLSRSGDPDADRELRGFEQPG